jgi:heme exporter protein A
LTESSNQPAVEIKRLSKDFGRVIALRNVDLQIEAGEFVTIFGRNGAGKTTLLNIMSGVTRPSDGSVLIYGADPQVLENRRRLAVISHEVFLYELLTAIENLEFAAEMYKLENPEERIKAVLNEVGLYHRRFDLTATFSRGMLQRLTIARALLHEPQILLLDEPFTGLDQHAIALLTELLGAQKAAGKTIMLTTHDFHMGLNLADRYVILEKRQVLDTDTMTGLSAEGLRQRYFDLIEGKEAGR